MVKEVEVDRDPESDPERREGEFTGETSSGGTLSCGETPAPAQPVRPGAIAVPGNRPSSHWDMLDEDDDDEDDTRGRDDDELPVAAAISPEDEDAAFFGALDRCLVKLFLWLGPWWIRPPLDEESTFHF